MIPRPDLEAKAFAVAPQVANMVVAVECKAALAPAAARRQRDLGDAVGGNGKAKGGEAFGIALGRGCDRPGRGLGRVGACDFAVGLGGERKARR